MAITVEDGTGKTDADAYISVADADTYWTLHGAPAEWTAATTAQKETAIRQATTYIDITYASRWDGVRSNETQALAWPRTGIVDADGYALDSDEIPIRLGYATAEAAYRYVVDSDALLPDITSTTGGIRGKRVRVGSIEEEIQYSGNQLTQSHFGKIEGLLYAYVRSWGFIERS